MGASSDLGIGKLTKLKQAAMRERIEWGSGYVSILMSQLGGLKEILDTIVITFSLVMHHGKCYAWPSSMTVCAQSKVTALGKQGVNID